MFLIVFLYFALFVFVYKKFAYVIRSYFENAFFNIHTVNFILLCHIDLVTFFSNENFSFCISGRSRQPCTRQHHLSTRCHAHRSTSCYKWPHFARDGFCNNAIALSELYEQHTRQFIGVSYSNTTVSLFDVWIYSAASSDSHYDKKNVCS